LHFHVKEFKKKKQTNKSQAQHKVGNNKDQIENKEENKEKSRKIQ